VAPLKTAHYECCLSLVGLYIEIKANKRRIHIINHDYSLDTKGDVNEKCN
jgi:hypothetical protein